MGSAACFCCSLEQTQSYRNLLEQQPESQITLGDVLGTEDTAPMNTRAERAVAVCKLVHATLIGQRRQQLEALSRASSRWGLGGGARACWGGGWSCTTHATRGYAEGVLSTRPVRAQVPLRSL